MESHVLLLICPEKASGYICQTLKLEISKMKSQKGDRYTCPHCRKTWLSNKLCIFRNHLITNCLPKQGFGVTLQVMLEQVSLKYPLLKGWLLNPLASSDNLQNSIDCVDPFFGSLPTQSKVKFKHFKLGNDEELKAYLEQVSIYLDSNENLKSNN